MAMPSNEWLCRSKSQTLGEETAHEAMRLAAHKLPVKTRFVKREEGE